MAEETTAKHVLGTKKSEEKVVLTWQQKLEQGVPLNVLDEVKADADFNYRTRLRQAEEQQAFDALKNRGRDDTPAPQKEGKK